MQSTRIICRSTPPVSRQASVSLASDCEAQMIAFLRSSRASKYTIFNNICVLEGDLNHLNIRSNI